MNNTMKAALAAVLAIGLASSAQAGEGSIDSDNNVIGTQQYPNEYEAGYAPEVMVIPGYETPAYEASAMVVGEDENTGYAPRITVEPGYDYE
jgi:hypothetical protein